MQNIGTKTINEPAAGYQPAGHHQLIRHEDHQLMNRDPIITRTTQQELPWESLDAEACGSAPAGGGPTGDGKIEMFAWLSDFFNDA